MTEKTFKSAKANGKVVIYPHPIKKGEKYLIRPSSETLDKGIKIFICSLDFGIIPSPKESPLYYKDLGLHDDGQTPIFGPLLDQFHFSFLAKREIDPKKGEAIEKVLSNKVRALILAKTEDDYSMALEDFKKRFEAQTQCSTCQKMGINSENIQKWVDSIPDYCNIKSNI